MDGLMLDTERLFMQAYQQAAAECGFAMTEALYFRMLGHSEHESHQILQEGLPKDAPFAQIITRAKQLYYDIIFGHGVDIQPGLVELLNFLDETLMPRGVATSTHYEWACIKLKSVGLLHRFDHLTCGDQVENGKPAPDIFLRTAAKMGVPPENCVVLEDSLAGLQGARAAGMMPVLIPDLTTPCAEMKALAEVMLPSLTEFHACFRQAM